MIYDVTAAPYNGQRYATRAAALAGSHLGDALRAACLAAHNAGGGVVLIPSGWYLCDRGFDIRALSNVRVQGEGMDITNIVAAASLDGRDNYFYNDVFMGLNFTAYDPVKGGYPWKNLGVTDMTIDCTLQNPSGIVPNSGFGRSLAGVEIMNVDEAYIKRVKIIGAYGNGAVISSADPRLVDGNGIRVGVLDPIIDDCVFESCIRGPLPQYAGPRTPEGITGTVIQIGAALGGRIRNPQFRNSGGPIIDRFNCDGLVVDGGSADGFGATPVGTNADGTEPTFSQGVNFIRSDFGLKNCKVLDFTFRNGGGIYDKGAMVEYFFNGNIRTPGPQGCTYENIVMRNAKGQLQIQAPAVTGPGGQYGHRKPTDKYTHPVMIQFQEWVAGGVTVSVLRAGSGAWVPLPISPNGVIVIRRNDTIAVNYANGAWNWAWYLCPNADYPGIHLSGGSEPGFPGTNTDCILSNILIEKPGMMGVEIIDGVCPTIDNVKVRNPGVAGNQTAFALKASNPLEAETGTRRGIITQSDAIDTRAVSQLWAFVQGDGQGKSKDNRIFDNWIGQRAAGSPYAMQDLDRSNYNKDNKGPGGNSSVTGYAPPIPVSNTEIFNPFNVDCLVAIQGATWVGAGKFGATAYVGSTTFAYVPQGECIRIVHAGAASWVWAAVV